LTDALLATFGRQIDRIVLRPSSGGRFEVTINGEQVYSKAATGKHTTNEAILAEVRRRLPAPGEASYPLRG
jgi:selT/selW/selH-like putative selenoprotein